MLYEHGSLVGFFFLKKKVVELSSDRSRRDKFKTVYTLRRRFLTWGAIYNLGTTCAMEVIEVSLEIHRRNFCKQIFIIRKG